MVRRLNRARQKTIIPTPVTAEILTAIGPTSPDYLRIINKARIFDARPFDELAAFELAFLNRDIFKKQDATGGLDNRQKVKVDRQILAICRVAGCDTIYTDDTNLQNRARMCDIKAFGVADLAVPASALQGELELEQHEEIPEAESRDA